MKLTLTPGRPLRGACELPGDKSISHRAILLGAMAAGTSEVEGVLVSGVTRPLLEAVRACGADWTLAGPRLTIRGPGWRGFSAPATPLYCGNSATTLRLLAGALAAAGVPAVLDGSAGLRRRPMHRVIDPLRRMGVAIRGAAGHTAPLTLERRPAGRTLDGLDERLTVASAQVKTAILLAALAAREPVTVHEPTLSRDHTERMLRSLGVPIETTIAPDGSAAHRLTPPAGHLPPFRLRVPGDFSSAAFLLAAALVTPGSVVRLPGVGLNPGRTGLLDALREMGGDIRVTNERETGGEPVGDLEARHSALHGIRISGARVQTMIDEFPALAAVAVYADGVTEVREAGELRHKESDRISALCREWRNVGASIEEFEDGFAVAGGTRPRGGTANPHGDHRLAMSAAVLGLAAAGPVTVTDAEITEESFPDFPGVLRGLGAAAEEGA